MGGTAAKDSNGGMWGHSAGSLGRSPHCYGFVHWGVGIASNIQFYSSPHQAIARTFTPPWTWTTTTLTCSVVQSCQMQRQGQTLSERSLGMLPGARIFRPGAMIGASCIIPPSIFHCRPFSRQSLGRRQQTTTLTASARDAVFKHASLFQKITLTSCPRYLRLSPLTALVYQPLSYKVWIDRRSRIDDPSRIEVPGPGSIESKTHRADRGPRTGGRSRIEAPGSRSMQDRRYNIDGRPSVEDRREIEDPGSRVDRKTKIDDRPKIEAPGPRADGSSQIEARSKRKGGGFKNENPRVPTLDRPRDPKMTSRLLCDLRVFRKYPHGRT